MFLTPGLDAYNVTGKLDAGAVGLNSVLSLSHELTWELVQTRTVS